MITWVMFLAVGIVLGVGIGIYVSRLDDAAKRTENTLKQQLSDANSEIDHYKHQVSEHFQTTASLVNNLTESYRAVHEHLALGANDLCDKTLHVGFADHKMLPEDISPVNPHVDTVKAETAKVEKIEKIEEVKKPVVEALAVEPESKISEEPETVNPQVTDVVAKPSEKEQKPTLVSSVTSPAITPEVSIELSESELSEAKLSEPELSEIDQSRINASRMVH